MSSRTLLTFALAVSSAASQAQWTATVIHPNGHTDSGVSFGVGDDAYGSVDGFAAGRFSGGGFTSLHPAGATSSGISAADGGHEYGVAVFGGAEHAGVWSGSAGSFQDWNPFGADSSFLYAAKNGVAGGYATLAGSQHATVWNGGGADDTTDLHDASWKHSSVDAFDGDEQFGDATLANGEAHAVKWSGSAASAIDLNPVWALQSQIVSANNGRQVGWADAGFGYRATLWSGSAGSATDICPAGYDQSIAYDVAGFDVSGTVMTGSDFHAGYWDLSQGTFTDLHSSLSGYSASAAFGVQAYNGEVRIYGQAWNTVTEHYEAVVWSKPVPEPATLPVFGAGMALVAAAKRRRSR